MHDRPKRMSRDHEVDQLSKSLAQHLKAYLKYLRCRHPRRIRAPAAADILLGLPAR